VKLGSPLAIELGVFAPPVAVAFTVGVAEGALCIGSAAVATLAIRRSPAVSHDVP
jgi:hypothetical protein